MKNIVVFKVSLILRDFAKSLSTKLFYIKKKKKHYENHGFFYIIILVFKIIKNFHFKYILSRIF